MRFLRQLSPLLLTLLLLALLLGSCAVRPEPRQADSRPPNVVIVFSDDLGYGDVGVYGAEGIETPNLDRMAAEGMRFTDFHVAEPVCTASRTALLTGSYAQRVGLGGAIGPGSKIGIAESELLLPELLREEGYATAIFGKWHLGDRPPFLPTRHGFDEYYGIPYSNDMWPRHPNPAQAAHFPPLPLLEGEEVLAYDPDQTRFTAEFTRRAVDFIDRHRDRPFFVYLAHPMPHVPLFTSDRFAGSSRRGLYGDVIQEIDWSVGEVLRALEERGLDERTLVLFTSDNGPWLSYGDHAGSAGTLREGKHTSFEGGHRVPALFRWPGHIPAGAVSTAFASTMDVLPTVARLVGGELPEHPIDGHDIWPLLAGEADAASPWEVFYHYRQGRLEAVRSGRWKLVLPHPFPDVAEPGTAGRPGVVTETPTGPSLYDVVSDPGETRDVAADHPDVLRRLEAAAEEARRELGDALTERTGSAVRQPGSVED